MKRLLLIVLPLLLIVGCSKEPINYETTLVEREGVFYTKDTNKPYSGQVFSLYDNNIKQEGFFKEGLTYKQISDKMNEMGLSPIRTNKFSPSTVHSLEKKMEKRINRLTRVSQPTLGEMKLVFESIY